MGRIPSDFSADIANAIMDNSGEHDNHAYNFVDVAMKKVGSNGSTKIRCYYFFIRREDTPEVDWVPISWMMF
jgi:uncharacterized protein (DUF2252 family)